MIRDRFLSPENENRALFRWWFPDAGADLKKVAAQVQEFARAGYGGVSVTMVPQFTDFDAAAYGWGTPAWREILRTIMKTAREIPGFVVDLHPTAHWPAAINSVLPNDERQTQELVGSFEKLTRTPRRESRIPMPKAKTNDQDAEDAADYIFVDRFVAMTTARVAEVDGQNYTLDWDSLTDLSDYVKRATDPQTGEEFWTPAGIPEHETAFGSAPKLQDRQYYYQTDRSRLPASDNDDPEIRPGDWLLFGFWQRGTAQSVSGRGWDVFALSLPMAPKMYTINPFETIGVKAVTDYWDEHIFNDAEMRELAHEMGRRGSMMLGMGIGAETVGRWSAGMAESFERNRGYSVLPYLPLVVYRDLHLQFYPCEEPVFMTADNGGEIRVLEDFNKNMFAMLKENNFEFHRKWAAQYGYGIRAEHDPPEAESSEAAFFVDQAQGQNLYYGKALDNFRDIAGGVHISGRSILASEMCTEPIKAYSLPWSMAAGIINTCFGAGVNRCIFHGASFDEELSGKYSQWPGWHAFQFTFADAWGRRHPAWTRQEYFSDYLARTQAVLQGGLPQVDIFAFEKSRERDLPIFNDLLACGYTYDVGGEYALHAATEGAVNKRLLPDGPAYKAVIVRRASAISKKAAEMILNLADAGIPIVVLGDLPERVTGVEGRNGVFDQDIRNIAAQWLEFENVLQVQEERDLPEAMKRLNVYPDLEFCSERILSVERREENDDRYFFLYNTSDSPETIRLSHRFVGRQCYVLDAWSGTVYSLPEERLRMERHEAKLVVFARPGTFEGVHSYREKGRLLTELSDWSLEIESWGPAHDPEDPCASKKTVLHIGKTALTHWRDLTAPEEELNCDGCSSMRHVSGIGRYRTVYTAQRDMDAMLVLEHGEDMLIGVYVNGKEQLRPDQATGHCRICLTEGENEIEILDASTLKRRVNLENPFFGEDDFQRMFACIPNYSNAPAPDPERMDLYGITKAMLYELQTP